MRVQTSAYQVPSRRVLRRRRVSVSRCDGAKGTKRILPNACTDGTFDGTCRANGRCGLEIPPNEVSFQFISGECEGGNAGEAADSTNDEGTTDGDSTADANAGVGDFSDFINGNSDEVDENEDTNGVDGQTCTDGTFDGTCREDGRCGLEIPSNEVSFQQISGRCGL
ncbi:hypothetical protein M426DRAFT_28877 [Hypoxylon sp. CI-4A]|nr:hypothetical protein M426DRAFT_28877 [Hypoxylon sp. CI-4A]